MGGLICFIVIVFGVVVVMLVIVYLFVEYGIDFMGFGEVLGFIEMG